jgi:hypothetical protein
MAGPGNNHFDSPASGRLGELGRAPGSPMGRGHGYLEGNAELAQDCHRLLHDIQVRIAPHDDADLGPAFFS